MGMGLGALSAWSGAAQGASQAQNELMQHQWANDADFRQEFLNNPQAHPGALAGLYKATGNWTPQTFDWMTAPGTFPGWTYTGSTKGGDPNNASNPSNWVQTPTNAPSVTGIDPANAGLGPSPVAPTGPGIAVSPSVSGGIQPAIAPAVNAAPASNVAPTVPTPAVNPVSVGAANNFGAKPITIPVAGAPMQSAKVGTMTTALPTTAFNGEPGTGPVTRGIVPIAPSPVLSAIQKPVVPLANPVPPAVAAPVAIPGPRPVINPTTTQVASTAPAKPIAPAPMVMPSSGAPQLTNMTIQPETAVPSAQSAQQLSAQVPQSGAPIPTALQKILNPDPQVLPTLQDAFGLPKDVLAWQQRMIGSDYKDVQGVEQGWARLGLTQEKNDAMIKRWGNDTWNNAMKTTLNADSVDTQRLDLEKVDPQLAIDFFEAHPTGLGLTHDELDHQAELARKDAYTTAQNAHMVTHDENSMLTTMENTDRPYAQTIRAEEWNQGHPDAKIPVPNGKDVPYYAPGQAVQAVIDARTADAQFKGQESKYYKDYITSLIGKDASESDLAAAEAIAKPLEVQTGELEARTRQLAEQDETNFKGADFQRIKSEGLYKDNLEAAGKLQTQIDDILLKKTQVSASTQLEPGAKAAMLSGYEYQNQQLQDELDELNSQRGDLFTQAQKGPSPSTDLYAKFRRQH